MQSRWKSRTALMALISLILFVLKNYFNIEIPKVNELIELIFVLLVALGIYNNPTNERRF